MMNSTLLAHLRSVAVERLVAKFAARGLQLTEYQRKRLDRAFENGSPITLRFPGTARGSHLDALTLDESDWAAVEAESERLGKNMEKHLLALSESLAPQLREHVLKQCPAEIRAETREVMAFRRRLGARWKWPFSLAHLVIGLSERMAPATLGTPPRRKIQPKTQLESVLRLLHARGVRIAKEVLTLLEAGYADGAMARWRTLHEVNVMAHFIQKNGEECALRYVAHEDVENFRGATRYSEFHERLGYEPLTESEEHSLKAAFDAATAKYGTEFARDYGWAEPWLGGKPSSFSTIEQIVSFDHLRPFYRLAGHSVHANPKGILFALTHDHRDVLLLGPSNNGLADPGQNMGLSLTLLTSVLLPINPSLDTLVIMRVMTSLAQEAAEAWAECQARLDDEETHLRKAEGRRSTRRASARKGGKMPGSR
jgi:hypothetical protein